MVCLHCFRVYLNRSHKLSNQLTRLISTSQTSFSSTSQPDDPSSFSSQGSTHVNKQGPTVTNRHGECFFFPPFSLKFNRGVQKKKEFSLFCNCIATEMLETRRRLGTGIFFATLVLQNKYGEGNVY